MTIEIRGPMTLSGSTWEVYVDGQVLPGYVMLLGGQYRVYLGRVRGIPCTTLEAAAQALVAFHVGR